MSTERIRPSEAHRVASQLLLGAGSSVEMATNVGYAFTHVYTQLRTEDLLTIGDPRLLLRCMLGIPLSEPGVLSPRYLAALREPGHTSSQGSQAWDVKLMEQWQGEHFIIIDRGVALVSRATARTSPSALTLTDRAKEVESLLARFEAQWAKATPITLLYRDRDASAEGEQKRRLLVVSHEVWDDLIQELARHPQLMRAMTPRKFEELVAELLSRKGLKVSLTPHTRDGGRDILASLDSAMGDHLYLVECKRYAPDRLVGVELVRHLYGVVEIERATAGVLVTTSSFTSGARDLERTINHRLSLRDYDDLVIWLKSVVAV